MGIEPLSFGDMTPEPSDPPRAQEGFITPNPSANGERPERPVSFADHVPKTMRERLRNRMREEVKQSAQDASSKVEDFFSQPVSNRKGQFVKPLTEMYTSMAFMVAPFNQNVARAIAMNASKCAEAWDELAHQNEAVRKALKGLLSTNATVAVVIAHVPILLAVAAQVPAVQTWLGSRFGGAMDDIDKVVGQWAEEQQENE